MQIDSRIDVNPVDWLALLLTIVGAINWGLVGLGQLMDQNWNLVEQLLGFSPLLESVVYLLVGLAGLYLLYILYQLYAAETRYERTEPEPVE